MTSPASAHLLDELQTALAHGTVARRVETLRQVTDLFLHAADSYSDDQIGVFDDVLQFLLRHIEDSAKILLARRLAPVPQAPPQTIRALAFDDAIDIAAPVLTQSSRLTDDLLVENARTKSQAHLLAISARSELSGAVTDVLIERGDNAVVQRTAANPGARFSENGYAGLLARAERDDEIALCVGLRRSIPRQHYLKLLAKASATVRARLEAAHPRMADDVSAAVGEVTRRARSAPAAISEATRMAHGLVRSLYEDGRLDEYEIVRFAAAGKFDETNAALACLANAPVTLAETMMVESRTEGVMILAKVAGLSWPTVQTIIEMRAQLSGMPAGNALENQSTYERLRVSTAQQVLRFHKMQETMAGGC
jgi:uncharacterized protein (DUF2336 family)